MSDDNQQMDEHEFLKANFFMPDNEFAALKAKNEQRRAAKAKRQAALIACGVAGLRVIAKALDAMPPRAQYAAVRWIADRWHFDAPPPLDDGATPPAPPDDPRPHTAAGNP